MREFYRELTEALFLYRQGDITCEQLIERIVEASDELLTPAERKIVLATYNEVLRETLN